MNSKRIFFLTLILVASIQIGVAQNDDTENMGSVVMLDSLVRIDTLINNEKTVVPEKAFKPNPKKAVIYSAIFPGLGQIYNRKYWKLPIVYGGFMGCAYAITWNNGMYQDYSEAYIDLERNPDSELWKDFYRPGTDFSNINIENVKSILKRKKDVYRRYRDLSIIVTAALYLITIVDAYVDAQLFDFDISPDVGMKIAPTYFDKSGTNARSYGLQCNIEF